ncbi:hypothetical protein NHN26_00360 [Rhodovulum tesquicola]|uniref:hypothetical protein n=1 Tax=Rhodovulum tesquicola TaxID=540254 RepID=UPI002097E891|nr:hypothetical protein [Rhodovulum tesquicola]MCO8143662.1 hypothetical protein [Rhodovulum tesquicola]
MADFIEMNMSDAPSADQLAQWQQELEARNPNRPDPNAVKADIIIAQKGEIRLRGGQIESLTDYRARTAYVPSQLRPGHVMIPGFGETTIDAAIAGGLLPQGWTPEQGFEQPVAGTEKANAAGDQTDTEDKAASRTEAEWQAAADEAGQILQGADQALGSHAVDRALHDAADHGEIPTAEGMPEGVTEEMVAKVYAGYVAQSEATLSEVGASIATLSETLTDEELRQARHAAIQNDAERMKELGRVAVERLAKMPQTDPEGFLEMVEGMTPAERKMIRQDRLSKEWRITVPGHPEVSFGAAVRMGLVRV